MSKQRELDLADIGKKLANAQSKEALIKFLPQAASMLEDVEQSPLPSTIFAMKGCSDALVDPTLLGHKDKDVAVLVALCISEIMRIVAPDAPYSDDCLKEIFQLIVGIFQGLDDVHSPSFSSRVNILETVAKVRSCVVMLDLDCDDLITEMFEIFFTTASDKHPEHVFLAMRNVLSLVIEEGEEVSSQILEVILNNLLRRKEGVSQAGHKLAVAVVEKCADILEPYVQQSFTLAMLEGRGLQNTLKNDYHELIYELYSCSPQMLLGVLPNLREELVSNQVPIRLKATRLLGRMFALPGRQAPPEYQQLFSEFLKRLNDEDVDVQVAAINCTKVCLETMKSSSVQTSEILVAIGEQLCCFDDGVRIAAMNIICDFARKNLNFSPPGILCKVADCLHDTKESIRIETLHKLAGIYSSYCTKCFQGFEAVHDQFEWIPSKILRSCYGKGSADFIAQDMEIVICEELFDAELPVEEQAKHWVAFFSTFDEQDKIVLQHILSQKRRLQSEMLIYLSEQQTAEEKKEMPEFQSKMESRFSVIADQFVDPPKAKEHLQELHKMSNYTVFKELSILLDPSTSTAHAHTVCVDLLKKIGENHPQHDFLKILTTKCAYLLFSREHAHAFIQEILTYKNSAREEPMTSTIDLLLEVAAYYPKLIDDVKEDLQRLSKDDQEFIGNRVLDIISKPGSSSYAHAAGSEVSRSEELRFKEDHEQTKSAAAETAMTADSGLSSAALYESSAQSQKQGQGISDVEMLSEEDEEEEPIDDEANHNQGEHKNDILAKGAVGTEPRLAEMDVLEDKEKEQEEEELILVKRKRGRPKGSSKKLASSGRMRSVGQIGPKKVSIVVNNNVHEEMEQHDGKLPIKRKRGRPKGSNKKDGSEVAEEAQKDGVKEYEDYNHVKNAGAGGTNKNEEDGVANNFQDEVNDSSNKDVVQEHEGGGMQDHEADESQVHHTKGRVQDIEDVEVQEDVVAEPKSQENNEAKIEEAVVDVVRKPDKQDGMKEEGKDGIKSLAVDNVKDPEEEVRHHEKDVLGMEVIGNEVKESRDLAVKDDGLKDQDTDKLEENAEDTIDRNINGVIENHHKGDAVKVHVDNDATKEDEIQDREVGCLQVPNTGESGENPSQQEDVDPTEHGIAFGEAQEFNDAEDKKANDHQEYVIDGGYKEVTAEGTKEEGGLKERDADETNKFTTEGPKEHGGLGEQDADETNKFTTEGPKEHSGLEDQDADETNNDKDRVMGDEEKGLNTKKDDAGMNHEGRSKGHEEGRVKDQVEDEIKDQEETRTKDCKEDGKDKEEGDGGVVLQKLHTQEEGETEQEEEDKENTQKSDTGDHKLEDGKQDHQQGSLSAKRKRGRPKGSGRKPKHGRPRSLSKKDVKEVTVEVEKDQIRDLGMGVEDIKKVGEETPQRLTTQEEEEGEKDQEKHLPTKRKRGRSKGSRKASTWGTLRNEMDGEAELGREMTEKDGEDQEENLSAKRKHLPEDSRKTEAEEAGYLEHSSKNHVVEVSSKDKGEEAGVDPQDSEQMPRETEKEEGEKDPVQNLSAKRKVGRPKGSAAKNKRKLSVADENAGKSHEETLDPKRKRGGHIESSDKKEIIAEVFEKDVKTEGNKGQMDATPKFDPGQPKATVDKDSTTYAFCGNKMDRDKKDGDMDTEEKFTSRPKPGHPKGSGKKQIMGESRVDGNEQEGSLSTMCKNQGHPKSSSKKATRHMAVGDVEGRQKEEEMEEEEGQTTKVKPGHPKSSGKKEIRSTSGVDGKTGEMHEENNNTSKTKRKPGQPKSSINKAVSEVSSGDEKTSSSAQKNPAQKIAADRGQDEDLVGSSIKVWWPLDQRFYKGEVISYDAKKKRHKVLYDDGEQEILDLVVEQWQLTTKKQRVVKNPQDTSLTPAWAPVPLWELTKTKALAQEEDVCRPSDQLKQQSSSKSGKKAASQGGSKSKNLEARFVKAKSAVKTISTYGFDEDNYGEAPTGGKTKGKQFQQSSLTSKGSSGKIFKHGIGDSAEKATSRDSEGNAAAAAALSPDTPGDGEPLNTWVIRRHKVQ